MVFVFQIIIFATIVASGKASITVGIGWGIWTLAVIRTNWLKNLQLAVVFIATLIGCTN